ncbi:hypothetical protein OAS_00380 [Vibrio cyclitrophicus ZF65]|uniref:hypothetical protein n=1 Tax=Vibrio TaxID=662 RepID=UPI0002D3762D|nr:hypothetical protein [Vibrio cyclitrophicus]OED77984.1 hypothetical protein OAS_00380 [Vibrio cyclitrophicus ZF65]
MRIVKVIVIYLAVCHIILVSKLIFNLFFDGSIPTTSGAALLGTNDILPILISLAAFCTSVAAFYFSHFHKPSSAVLTYCNRHFGFATQERGVTRELTYTLSNTGKQGLYIKDVSILFGSSPLGSLRHPSPYLVIETDPIEPCVLMPGEIKEFKLVHEADFYVPEEYDDLKHQFLIVCLKLISANGKRYELSHDISELGPTGPDLSHKIWQGVPLGRSV